ncbi:MAG: PHP domain-containing protein [Clostridia bacterium]|nr:PHP domain-containing protein [Clostridia bacterium]
MKRFYYDLHVHSCLSPCGDMDNTPANIAGMASLCEVDIVALTDHNTSKNCPAFFEAASRYGIIPVAGMELTTSEEIHVVCLFETLEDALDFDAYISTKRILIKNRADIFGEQLILNGNDEPIGQEEHLLTVATTVSIEDVPSLVEKYRGVCYPAHIDRQSYGIVAVLGTVPKTPHFPAVEFSRDEIIEEYRQKYCIGDKITVRSSDAHTLGDIPDRRYFFELPVDNSSPSEVRRALINHLRGKK